MASRDYRLDLLAAGVMVFAIFSLGSILSFDAGDPPTDHVFPANETVQNWCGPVGAWLAAGPVEVFGVGAFGWVGWLVLASVALAMRLPTSAFLRQTFGILVLTVAGVIAADLSGFGEGFQTIGSSGGTLGKILAHELTLNVSSFGTGIVLLASVLLGTYLTLGTYAIVLAQRLGTGAKRGATGLGRGAMALYGKLHWPSWKRHEGSESEEEESEEESEEADDEAVAEDDCEEEEAEEEDEDEIRIIRTGLDDPDLPKLAALAAKMEETASVKLPGMEILDDSEPFEMSEHESEIRERAKLLEKTFAEFSMKVKVVQIDTGPVVTQYEIELEPGLRARKVMAMSDDIAIALKASSVRIVAPIPGKNTVGIEVPNARRAKVGLKEVMLKSAATSANMRLPMFLGKDVKGQAMVNDLATMPHLLIAGRTGTGKSVCLNTLILSILMTRTPDQVKMLMIDPKMVELSLYRSIPHLMHPVVTDMKKAEAILAWAVEKMEERYALLAQVGVRHIDSYNALPFEEICERIGVYGDEDKERIPKQMPYILIFADELADLMMTAAKEVESHIIRLAQKSRAVGIHLILATQKPTVDVVTGLIKSNLPARIAFQVASRTDSRVVLDEIGADKLLGNGDMLFLYPGTSKITRAQGTFVSDDEVNKVVTFLSNQARPQFSEELLKVATAPKNDQGGSSNANKDDMYEAAVEVVIREQRGSVSLLQRALGLGYGRAARLIDYMAEDGIVGEYNGSQAREVLIKPEQWENFRTERFARAG